MFLWELLKERDDKVNILHAQMPSWDQHVKFVESRPYDLWFFIVANGRVVGATYLTRNSEIGIFIFKSHQGHGYGPRAIELLMVHGGKRPYLANINPENARSTYVFSKLGFKWKSSTYAIGP